MKFSLVDSLTHPSVGGTWMNRAAGADFNSLIAEMKAAHVAAACAIGMWGMDNYEHESFMSSCRRHRELIPVAGYKPVTPSEIGPELDHLKELGFTGIKLHPRYSKIDISSNLVSAVLNAARDRELVVFYCTYMHGGLDQMPDEDPFTALVRSLKSAPGAKVVLVHGGDVELLRYMQLVRFNDNLLLDLSHTLLKYPGSSLDLDIGHLFRHFDRRICVGSDWPQFPCSALRGRFEDFAAGLEETKARNIASLNLLRFLRVGSTFDCG